MNTGVTTSRSRGSRSRQCARAGCATPAVTTLRFEPTLRHAWLVDLDGSAARTQGDLCRRHADALVLPRGWKLHDERTDRGPRPVEQPAAAVRRSPRRVRVRSRATATPPEPVATPGELPGSAPVVARNGNGSVPAQFGANDADDEIDGAALDAVLDARTPLLQRAFRNAQTRG
jgi:Protein of unknown function (DUF3499)